MQDIRRRWTAMVGCVCFGIAASGCVREAVDPGEGFEALVRQFSSAWQNADAHAIAGLFTLDGSLVVPDGRLVEGRAAIEGFYRSAFASGYAGSRVDSRMARAYPLRRDIALVDAEWHIGAIRGNPNEPDERGILCAVLVRVDHGWAIAALREQAGATTIQRAGP